MLATATNKHCTKFEGQLQSYETPISTNYYCSSKLSQLDWIDINHPSPTPPVSPSQAMNTAMY
eukprot:scaffold3505_cov115-Skeletonema_marinoi.AAC.3